MSHHALESDDEQVGQIMKFFSIFLLLTATLGAGCTLITDVDRDKISVGEEQGTAGEAGSESEGSAGEESSGVAGAPGSTAGQGGVAGSGSETAGAAGS